MFFKIERKFLDHSILQPSFETESRKWKQVQASLFFRSLASFCIMLCIKLLLGVYYDLMHSIWIQWIYELAMTSIGFYIFWKKGYQFAAQFTSIVVSTTCLGQILFFGSQTFLVRFPIFIAFLFFRRGKNTLVVLLSVIMIYLILFPAVEHPFILTTNEIKLLYVDSLVAVGWLLPSWLYLEKISEFTQYEEAQVAIVEEELRQRIDFIRKVCHELRTPFAGIMGYLELLRTRSIFEKDSVAFEYLQTMWNLCQQLLELINNILNFERMKQKNQLELEKVNVQDVTLFPIQTLLGITHEKNISLRGQIEKGTPRWILTNKANLQQILLNLLYNSIKFTEKGNVTLTVSLRDRESIQNTILLPQHHHSQYILFCVRDTGIGISSKDMQSIFLPFKQVKRDDRGSGLGLSSTHINFFFAHLSGIVKGLVENLNGIIVAESLGIGFGSCFSVYLPHMLDETTFFVEDMSFSEGTGILATYTPVQPLNNTTIIPESSPPTMNKPRVLIAEDNITNQIMLKLLLKKLGFEVIATNNGKEAMQEYIKQKEKLSLVILDLEMPLQNGLDTAKELRKQDTSIPIFILTAHNIQKDEQCAAVGVDKFLTKPVTLEKLQQECKAILG